MPRSPAPDLDAWPGETTRPPLRLLEGRRLSPGRHALPAAPTATWLQRMRQLLRARAEG